MELCVYDTNINLLGVVDEIMSCLWIRRYWSIGEFKLLVPYTERHVKLLKIDNLLMLLGDTHAGQIRYIHIAKDAFGMENIEIQGFLLAGWIGKRLVLPRIISTDTGKNLLNRIVDENLVNPANTARIIPNLTISDVPDLGGGQIDYVSEPFISALSACEILAKTAKLGFEIITDVREKVHNFVVYKGRDLTAEQSEKPPCIFSQEFDNVLEQEFTTGIENLRSVAYVGGEENEGEQRLIVEVGGGSGLQRDELFVNASDIQRNNNEITIPLNTYIDLLTGRGMEELERHTETLSFSSRINTHGHLIYKVDYDLGDRVTCFDRRWGVKINVRITEVTEIYQKDETDIEISFGEALPTLTEKIRR